MTVRSLANDLNFVLCLTFLVFTSHIDSVTSCTAVLRLYYKPTLVACL